MGQTSRPGFYNGYSSCPLFVGDGKIMLVEFKYGGVSDETFLSDQTVPRKFFYQFVKKVFPYCYFNLMPRGKWYGRRGLFKPTF
jgi:hypothetical protein